MIGSMTEIKVLLFFLMYLNSFLALSFNHIIIPLGSVFLIGSKIGLYIPVQGDKVIINKQTSLAWPEDHCWRSGLLLLYIKHLYINKYLKVEQKLISDELFFTDSSQLLNTIRNKFLKYVLINNIVIVC